VKLDSVIILVLTMSSPETQRRLARAKLIASTGYEIMPCSLCVENHTKCMMKDGWKNCSECTRRGRTCDGKGVTLTEGWFARSPLCGILLIFA
jgi:hypothetical protein